MKGTKEDRIFLIPEDNILGSKIIVSKHTYHGIGVSGKAEALCAYKGRRPGTQPGEPLSRNLQGLVEGDEETSGCCRCHSFKEQQN